MVETAPSSRLDGRIIAHRRCPSRKELFLLLRIGKLAGLAGAAIEPRHPRKVSSESSASSTDCAW